MSDQWQFNGENGCSRCQALTGIYPNAPIRPHKYCDCEIVRPGWAKERDCFDWDYDILENNATDVDVGEERHMKVRVIATCCDGRQTRMEIDKRWTHEGTDSERDMNAEIYQEADAWAEAQLTGFCQLVG